MEKYSNNNSEIPSLIDIALAYENGNNGEIKPKRKNSMYGTYKTLTNDEKSFIIKHPMLSYEFNNNANKARKIGRELGGESNGYGDAVRHCYWCALNQISAGYNSTLAKEFGDAHENIPNNVAKTMDLHNNSVGYYLGNQAIIKGWNEDELLNQVINAANNGELKIGL